MYYRKANLQNLDLYKELEGYELQPSFSIPKKLIGFNAAKSNQANKDTYIHFYLDDYQFERIWNAPDRYLNLFKSYGGIIGPDFSQYLDMPDEMKRWNDFRNKLLMKYYQKNGVDVIPNVSWSDANSFEYVFNELPKGSVISVSNIGCCKKSLSKTIFIVGLDIAISRLKPVEVLVYGNELDDNCYKMNVISFKSFNNSRRDDI